MRKIVALGLALLALFVIVGIGAALYLGRLVKKASEEARNKVIARTEPVQAGARADAKPDTAGPASAYAEWKPPADRSQLFASGKSPLLPGLTIVTAIAQPLVGDYESIKRIDRKSVV